MLQAEIQDLLNRANHIDGLRMARIRERLGLRQFEFGAMIGLSRNPTSSRERGETKMKRAEQIALAAIEKLIE